jgi:hypothetical protein
MERRNELLPARCLQFLVLPSWSLAVGYFKWVSGLAASLSYRIGPLAGSPHALLATLNSKRHMRCKLEVAEGCCSRYSWVPLRFSKESLAMTRKKCFEQTLEETSFTPTADA